MTNQNFIVEINNYWIDRKLINQAELCRRSILGYYTINKTLNKKRFNPTSIATLIIDIKKHYPNAIIKIIT